MAKIAERFSGESFILIGVDKGDEEIIWRNFILENEMNWTQHFDGDNKVVKAFNVTAFPTYIVIDHEGAILHRQRGTGGYSQITKVIKKALSEIP